MFEFKITSKDKNSQARTGEFVTPHGVLQTPALATVATEGIVRTVPKEKMSALPLDYAIVNTFHILTKDILPKISTSNKRDPDLHRDDKQSEQLSTVHTYGNFPGVVASDSGGFQVFSLGFGKMHNVGKHADKTRRVIPKESSPEEGADTGNPLQITEEGVTFSWNNKDIKLTPERSMEIQHQIGADIIFAFDECTSPHNSKEYTANSMEKTNRWLERCIAHHKELSVLSQSVPLTRHSGKSINGETRPESFLSQALFAIVQGGRWQDLRIASAKYCAQADVPGFGIGGSFGTSFGDSKQNMHQVLEWIIPHLPTEKPRHLLGIGQVDDLFECIERGVDLFDCVIPTREARHRVLYTFKGKFPVRKMKTLNQGFDANCKCMACQDNITWSQLHELFLKKDERAYFYATVHNIQFFADIMKRIREAIQKNTLKELKHTLLSNY